MPDAILNGIAKSADGMEEEPGHGLLPAAHEGLEGRRAAVLVRILATLLNK
jgi:hypothetical protein